MEGGKKNNFQPFDYVVDCSPLETYSSLKWDFFFDRIPLVCKIITWPTCPA